MSALGVPASAGDFGDVDVLAWKIGSPVTFVIEVPIQVLPTQNDGFDSPPGFVLVIAGAYAADMQQVNGQNAGCIFFNSSVPAKQIRHLQQDIENQSPATNGPAK
jgi:hypothetical protein